MLLVVVGCTSAVCQSVKRTTLRRGYQPPDWQTPLNGIISPSERGWSLKTTGRNPEVLTSRVDRVSSISMGNPCNYCEHNSFPAESNAQHKTGAIHLRMFCWVSVLTIFRRCHKFWLHRQFSSAQFQKRRNDGVMVSVLLLVCFEQ